MKHKRLVMIGVLLTIALSANTVLAGTYEDVSGYVNNNASWALYLTQRLSTATGIGPQLATFTWSGTDQYYYARRCNNDDPIGYGTPASPVKAAVNDAGWKWIGALQANTCFRMAAKKDWSLPGFGQNPWTGKLYY